LAETGSFREFVDGVEKPIHSPIGGRDRVGEVGAEPGLATLDLREASGEPNASRLQDSQVEVLVSADQLG
jgi:hypothetical protein